MNYLMFALVLFPTKHLSPPTTYIHEAGLKLAVVRPINEIPQTNLQPLQETPKQEPVQVAAPAPIGASGCVTGYATGNYALDQLIAHESGGRSCAENAGGCFGLLQACPGYPLKAACGGDPSCQIAWFQSNKTGGRSWDTIWASWQIKGWW